MKKSLFAIMLFLCNCTNQKPIKNASLISKEINLINDYNNKVNIVVASGATLSVSAMAVSVGAAIMGAEEKRIFNSEYKMLGSKRPSHMWGHLGAEHVYNETALWTGILGGSIGVISLAIGLTFKKNYITVEVINNNIVFGKNF